MTIPFRQINISITSIDGDKTKQLTLEGYRVECFVSSNGKYNQMGQAEIRIYGMSLSDMNAYSAVGSAMVASSQFNITISAGNKGKMPLLFSGSINASYIDLSGIPESSFVISATVCLNLKLKQLPDSSWKGNVDVATAIEKMAKDNGLGFINRGVDIKLTDMFCTGSVIDQIQQLTQAAQIPVAFDNNTVTIWENVGVRFDTQIEINASTGLVGFPSYTQAGLHIKTIFNPNIFIGRDIILTSTIPKANGLFNCVKVTHFISTLAPDGPWFSEADIVLPSTTKGNYV